MRPKSERDLRSIYPDLLTPEDDADTVALIRDLDTALQGVEPPPALWSSPPAAHRSAQNEPAVPLRLPDTVLGTLERFDRAHASPPPKRRGWSVHTKLYLAFATVLICLLVIVGNDTVAGPGASSVTDLGSPTSAVPPFNPVIEFRHVKLNLRSHGLPEVLFLGTQVDDFSAAERWPLVKALNQFGTWSGVTATATRGCYTIGTGRPPAHPPQVQCWDAGKYSGDATYDLSSARYRSPYLAFVGVDLIDRSAHLNGKVTSQERTLFNQYVRNNEYRKWSDTVWQTALSQATGGPQFPLLVVNSYLSVGTNVAIPGDLKPQNTDIPLAFSVIQESLQKGKVSGNKVTGAPPSLIQDYNAEANVITALICRVDGSKPKSVCGRTVIKAILKHVK